MTVNPEQGPPPGVNPPGLGPPPSTPAPTFTNEYLVPVAPDYLMDEVWQILSDQFAADGAAAGLTPGSPTIASVRLDQPSGNLLFVTLSG